MNNIDTYLTNAHSDDFATEAEERATLNTFAAEPAVEQEPRTATLRWVRGPMGWRWVGV